MKIYAVALFCLPLFAQHDMLPDPKLTPGATDAKVTQANIQDTICKDGYTKTVRNVTEAEKKMVMERYGLPLSDLSKLEIDHFVSLELGGSNYVTNLWPQYYEPSKGQKDYLGAREKDVVETNLAHRVCKGEIKLKMAVEIISSHKWIAEYYRIKAGN